MFFFIGGVQPKTVIIEKQGRLCPVCGRTELYKKRVDHYLSLFFIPVFPVKKGRAFTACNHCKTHFNEEGSMIMTEHSGGKIRCPHCGRHVEQEYTYCPYCGKGL